MSLDVDLFWSFRSPYSYLVTGRLVALTKRYDVDVRVRVVLPIAIRVPGFFAQVNPLWPPYLLRETMRIAEHLGIPFAWPNPDPVVQEWPSRRVAPEQPYIHRLVRLGTLAARRGRSLAFADEEGEPFFGQDRIDLLLWRLRQHGLRERA